MRFSLILLGALVAVLFSPLRADAQEAVGVQDPVSMTPVEEAPGLTEAERAGIIGAVSACWVMPPGAEASQIAVTVGFILTPEGRVANGHVALMTHDEASSGAVEQAFQSARRAVLRCQGDGYDLPPEAYAQWRDVQITFDPSEVAVR